MERHPARVDDRINSQGVQRWNDEFLQDDAGAAAYAEARVEKAAAALLADRFILPEDYEAYVRSAKRGW